MSYVPMKYPFTFTFLTLHKNVKRINGVEGVDDLNYNRRNGPPKTIEHLDNKWRVAFFSLFFYQLARYPFIYITDENHERFVLT